MIKRTSHSWVYKHRISLGVVAFILIACITLLFLATSAANRSITANTNKIAELNARYDKLLPELKTMRDARLAKEAADKAAEEAAAAKAAEQAKAATTATPATPAASSCRLSTNGHSNPNNIDILVNKTHCLSPLDFAPIDLVSVNGYLVSAKAAPHLRDMLAAAAAQGGSPAAPAGAPARRFQAAGGGGAPRPVRRDPRACRNRRRRRQRRTD